MRRAQIYNFETKFNFGKHKGKSLIQVLNNLESRYLGYLIANDVKRFILDPETLKTLEKGKFFDNLEMSYYGGGGSFPLEGIGLSKDDVLNILKKRYEDFINDPDLYERSL